MSVLTFTDDILLLLDSHEGLQELLRSTEEYFRNVNPSKSQYFGWRVDHYTHGIICDLTELQFQGTSLSLVCPDYPIKYLGLEFLVNKTPNINPAKAIYILQLIDRMSLKPFQKLHCV